MSAAMGLEERGDFPQAEALAVELVRPSRKADPALPVLRVLFDVLPAGGLPAGTFCATIHADSPAPGMCTVLVQLAPVHRHSRPAKRAHLATLATAVQQRCFDLHRVNVAEIYWSLAGDNFQAQSAPVPIPERQRIDDATYLMLERAINETPPPRKRNDAKRQRRRPRFA